MLLRNLNSSEQPGSLLTELADGLPTIAALARLCGHAMAGEIQATPLTSEALALVAAVGPSGSYEIRGDKDGFESSERLLAVCVEVTADKRLLFRDKSRPRQTVLFLDAFRQLCQSGFVVHHLLKDFSLSNSGFELADTLDRQELAPLIQFAVEIEH